MQKSTITINNKLYRLIVKTKTYLHEGLATPMNVSNIYESLRMEAIFSNIEESKYILVWSTF